MRFQTVKCNVMQLTKKLTNKVQAFYTLEDTVLENVERIKYLGVTITNDLDHKANRTFGLLGAFFLSPRCERSSL